MKLLSISIDLCGSTDAKSQLRVYDKQSYLRKGKGFEILLRSFINIESDFYIKCLSCGIPLERMYLVKTIGDEIWFVFDIGDGLDRTNRKWVYDLIQVLMNIVCKETLVAAYENFEENCDGMPTKENAPPKGKPLILSKKCFIDIIEEFVDINKIRSEEVPKTFCSNLQALSNAGKNFRKYQVGDLSIPLNLGIDDSGVPDNTKLRFDPVGHHVDLFFRCCNFAKPSLVRAGKRLMDELGVIEGGETLKIESGKKNGVKAHHLNCRSEKIPSENLKGIGYDYELYTLLSEIYTPRLGVNSYEYDDDGCKESRYYLEQNNFIEWTGQHFRLTNTVKQP